VFGGFSVRLLPLNLMPDISYPKLTVRTEYPGAAPAEVENNVARPLEEVLGVVTGVTRIESVSRAGYGDVILEFAWNTDMDEANQDVLEILDRMTSTLPDGVEQPLILRYDPTLSPIMTFGLVGGRDLIELRQLAEDRVAPSISSVEGVAAVRVRGGLEDEIQVRLRSDRLRNYGVDEDVIVARLAAENVNMAGGTVLEGDSSVDESMITLGSRSATM